MKVYLFNKKHLIYVYKYLHDKRFKGTYKYVYADNYVFNDVFTKWNYKVKCAI